MENENIMTSVLKDTEYVLSDIMLSGFHSIHASTMEKLKELTEIYSQYGMETGCDILKKLYENLKKRKDSFEYNLEELTETFCIMEFYIKNAYNY